MKNEIDNQWFYVLSLQYRQFFNEAVAALGEYANDVKTLVYPDKEANSWSMKQEEYERFMEGIEHIR